MIRRSMAVLILVAGLLGGCGGAGPTPTSTPASTPTTSVPTTPVAKRYATAPDVVAALEGKGVVCAGYDETEDPTGAVSRGSCEISGEEMVISTYAAVADAKGAPAEHAALLAGVSGTFMVVGENWTVNCSAESYCMSIVDMIGGEYVHLPA